MEAKASIFQLCLQAQHNVTEHRDVLTAFGIVVCKSIVTNRTGTSNDNDSKVVKVRIDFEHLHCNRTTLCGVV